MILIKSLFILLIGLQAVQCHVKHGNKEEPVENKNLDSVSKSVQALELYTATTDTQTKELENKTTHLLKIPVEKEQNAKELILESNKMVNSTNQTRIDSSMLSNPVEDTSPIEDIEPVKNIDKNLVKNTIKDTVKSISNTVSTVSHKILDDLLKKYVSSSGKVNYKSLVNEKKSLKTYLDQLATTPPQNDWSKERIMAYWINMYNAMTLYHITLNYPIKSIMDIDNGKIWDTKKIKVGSEYLTLNQIEKVKLLQKYGDYHIHFAVNCGAKSCPALLNRAWSEKTLYADFKNQAQLFIQNTSHNTIRSSSIALSQIFNWYASDFKQSPGYAKVSKTNSNHLISVIDHYHPTRISSSPQITYLEYDWRLNE